MRYRNLKTKSAKLFERFPLTMLLAIVGSIHFMVMIDNRSVFEEWYRLDLVIVLGISWLIGAQFFIEQFKTPQKWQWLKIIVLGLLMLFYWSLPEYAQVKDVVYSRFWRYLLAGHLFLFFAPFLTFSHKIAFWNYLKNILSSFGRSVLFSGVLYLGLVLASLAAQALLGINVEDSFFGILFVFCLGIINTITYLYDFPKNVRKNTIFVCNKPMMVFVKYILISLTILYFIILYLYAFKIIITWELPEGWLSGLITVLSILGFVIHIIINPVRKTQRSTLIKQFHPWFQILLLPLLVLLFIAVFKRIADYGFTVNRYLLMLLDCWIFGITLYLLFVREKQMRVLPISIFILLILGSVGPWGAFKVSLRSQLNQFKHIITQADPETGMLENQKIDRLYSIINYLQDQHKIDELTPIIGFNPEEAFADIPTYSIGNHIIDTLHISSIKALTAGKRYYYRRTKPIQVNIEKYTRFQVLEIAFEANDSSRLRLIRDQGDLKIMNDKQTVLQLKMDSVFLKIIEKRGGLNELSPDQLVFDYQNDKGQFKVIVKQISMKVTAGKIMIDNAIIYLFSKRETPLKIEGENR